MRTMIKNFFLVSLLLYLGSGAVFALQPQTASTLQHLPVKKTHAVHKKKKRHTKQVHVKKKSRLLPVANRQPAKDIPVQQPSNFASSIGQHLVNLVRKTVATLSYSVYKLGGAHFDTSHGVYIVDCSEYVDNLLQVVHPNAYSSLVDWSGSYKPTSEHYYDFFKELANDSDGYWNKINNVKQLQPGDVLVFRNKHHMRTIAQGHVMIVMDKPIFDGDGYLIRVADSAPVGHSEDTRQHHVSGIGIGTLVLQVDPKTGLPAAYAWRIGSRWESNVKFAMARPVGIDDLNQTVRS
jgi:hypothetical protein